MDSNSLACFFRETTRDDRGLYYTDSASGGERFVSFAAIFRQAERRAELLKAFGFRDRFLAAIWMEMSPECFQCFIAVVLAGGIPVPLHAAASWDEARAVLEKIEAEVLLTSAPRFIQAESRLGENLYAKVIDGATGELLHGSGQTLPSRRYTPPSETAVVFMSSGTTGSPKGIMLSDSNVISNARGIQQYLDLGSADRVLLLKSFGYCSTLTSEWFVALIGGANIHIPAQLTHPLFLVKHVRDFEISFVCTVPSMIIPLVQSKKPQLASLTTLKKMIIVGGHMPPDLLIRLQEQMPWATISTGYGLTEASPRVTYLPPGKLRSKPDSVGIPISDVSVSIYRDGQPLACGEVGEVVVNGPGVMLGYYDDEARTEAVLQHYGLRTADMGYLDEEGFLYVQGRSDNALNVAGSIVHPEAIERVLLTHPHVKEAAVAGRPDPIWGELPVAFAIMDDTGLDAELLKQELFCYSQQRLIGAQRPADIVIVDKLPKTRSEKIDRGLLRLMAKETSYVD